MGRKEDGSKQRRPSGLYQPTPREWKAMVLATGTTQAELARIADTTAGAISQLFQKNADGSELVKQSRLRAPIDRALGILGGDGIATPPPPRLVAMHTVVITPLDSDRYNATLTLRVTGKSERACMELLAIELRSMADRFDE